MSVLANLVVQLSANTAALERGLKGAGGHMDKLKGALKAGAMAGGAAIAGLGVASLKMGIDFEKSMAEVKTLMPDISEEVFGKMTDDVLAFSKEMGIATDKAVPALYQAISAGVPKENVMEFMKVASKAAIGGVTELETAVDGITSVINAYGAEAINAQKAADIMFTGVKLGKTTFDELSASLFNVVPIAAASGVSFEQVTAALAALTAQGVPTTVASTQLRAAIQALTAPTAKQSKMVGELGLNFSVAALEQKGLSGAMKEAIAATGGNMEQLRKLFGSVEAVQAVLALGGEQSHKFEEALNAMGGSAGAVDAAFETMAETTSYKLNKAINEIKVEMTKLAVKVLPLLVDGFEKAKGTITVLKPALVLAAGAAALLTVRFVALKVAALGAKGGIFALAAVITTGTFALRRYIDQNREAINKLPVLGGLVKANARYQRELNAAIEESNDLFERNLITSERLADRLRNDLSNALVTLAEEGARVNLGIASMEKQHKLSTDAMMAQAAELVEDMQRGEASYLRILGDLKRAGIDWKDTVIEDVLRPMRIQWEAETSKVVGYVGMMVEEWQKATPLMEEESGRLATETEQDYARINAAIKSVLPTMDEEFAEWAKRLTRQYTDYVNYESNVRKIWEALEQGQVGNIQGIVRAFEEQGPAVTANAVRFLGENPVAALDAFRMLGEYKRIGTEAGGDIVSGIEDEKAAIALAAFEFARELVTGFVQGLAAEQPKAIDSVDQLSDEIWRALHGSPHYKTWYWGTGMAEDLSRGWQKGLRALSMPDVSSYLNLPAATASLATPAPSLVPAPTGGAASGASGGSGQPIIVNIGDHGIYTMDRRQREAIVRQILPELERRMR